MHVPSTRSSTPLHRLMYPERLRMTPELPNYLYPTSPTPYTPPLVYPYPSGYFNIPPGDMADGALDYNPYTGYSPYPPPYPLYYNQPSIFPRRLYNPSYRTQDIRHHREEMDELNEKRARKANKHKLLSSSIRGGGGAESVAGSDINPDSLKNMLYDTLQQEMSALEVLKQQIASFTLLTHTLEQNDRGRTSPSEAETPHLGKAPNLSTPSSSTTDQKPQHVHYNNIPQFDSSIQQQQHHQQHSQGLYAIPAQNLKSPLASTNFINPQYYPSPYQYAPVLSDTISQQAQLLQYNPYSYPNNINNNFMTPTPSGGGQQIPDNVQDSSFFTMTHSGTSPASYGNLYPNYQPQPLPIYNSNVRRMGPPAPPVSSPNLLNSRHAADSYPDSFHDLAIQTLYDVERKLREAEEKISEKITEFESEVSAQNVAMPQTAAALPMYYQPLQQQQQPHYRRRSTERGKSSVSDMDPSMVKELAVRALQAIDRRLRAAEKTIDKTINNFDGMERSERASERAVKSATREVGVQTPIRESVYDSDTDDSQRHHRHSDS